MIYCSQGHENPEGSRFCLHCGEKLLDSPPTNQSTLMGKILSDRYSIVRQIGQGGFGRTYLAEDINRFRELCVLKEFSPQVQTEYVLQKAEELFQREATVLYRLQHSQIPRFRELFRTNIEDKEYLFLVQDYVEGETYRSLLDERQKQGLKFTEVEIRQLLQQILPVLDYIHSLGVIHRDISPDNLILRKSDQLPVLIDFGGVKQVAAEVASQYYQQGTGATTPPPTLLGKIGYAPPEQMQTGLVEPHSDLYALAATVLVLLTGKQPAELIDNYTLTWQWRREINLSPGLGMILDKMLSPTPNIRYQNAREILQALNPPTVNYSPPQPTPTPQPEPQTSATLAVSPRYSPSSSSSSPTPPSSPTPSTPSPSPSNWRWEIILPVALLIFTAAGFGLWTINNSQNDISDQYSLEERERKQKLETRRQQLGINEKFYIDVVNQLFWEQNPSLEGRILSDKPEDEVLRAQWDKIASQLLDKLTLLSSDARRKLSTYKAADRDRWKVQVNQLNVSSRALYDLGDAAFLQQFPQQQGKDFIDQPIGQIWHGFVADKLNAILAKSAYQKIVFATGASSKTVSGSLQPGNGKVFVAELNRNQLTTANLNANSKVLFSIYSPTGRYKFLEDSTRRSWSRKLPESGFYEFVIVSTGTEALDYRLRIEAENLTPTPTPTPTETPSPTPTPTETPSPTPTPTETPSPTPTPTETPSPTPTPTE